MNTRTLWFAGVALIGAAAIAPAAAFATTAMPSQKAMPAATPEPPTHRTGFDADFPVIQLQEALQANGADLRIDGVYGPRTEAALKAYQSKHGLIANGKLDHATRASLSLLG